jgi:Xaa-Pro aminopeptidase
MKKEQKARIEKLFALLGEEADGALITTERNCYYFSGFDFSDGCLLLTPTQCVLFTDFRYEEAAKATVDQSIFRIEKITALRGKQLCEVARELGISKLGYEDADLSCAMFDYYRKDSEGLTWVPLQKKIMQLRTFKSQNEIDLICKAQRIAEGALAETLKRFVPTMTEIEMAAELEYQMRKGGSQKPSFDTIAISGAHSALPHGVPQNVPLQKGFLTLDFGATYQGYCSDMTRTFYLGVASSEEKRVYETVLTAQKVALAKAQIDADCAMLHLAAQKVIDGAGYEKCFGHGLGHGVGLYIHEEPRLSPSGAGVKLTQGHVVTVEPGIYLEGRYGVRIEDMIAVCANGVENLTKAPKEFTQL